MRKPLKQCLILLLLPLFLLSLGCTAASTTEEAGQDKAAHDFKLNDLDGNEWTLSQFKGEKGILMAFGATWCPNCIDEIPELKEVYEKYKDEKLKLFYIDVQESHKKVSSFVKKRSIPYTTLLDSSGDVAKLYGVRGITHLVAINKDGSIRYEGPRPSRGLLPLALELVNDNN